MKDIEKRRRVMQRSMRLGHCICDPRQPCPCDEFKEFDVCHCAGERREITAGPVRLTAMVQNPGCASKIDQASLKKILAGLPDIEHPDVIVGAVAGDDAGVFRIGEHEALVQTVDVFCPSVDDPYTFGQVAAANSLSDVYAMGGRPLCALSVVGYPVREAPPEGMTEILRGGVEKMREAGVPVIGGHSINDPEIKAGFAVTGMIDPAGIVTNAGARPGDALVLTKPLGTGIVAFAGQTGISEAAWLEAAAESMTALNRAASQLMCGFGAHAATDVTGFGLAGHLGEMARLSGVDVEVVWDDIPFLPGVLEAVARGALPGGIERNRESSEASLDAGDELTREMCDICFDAQTSGGLLVALPPEKVENFVKRLHEAGVSAAAVIGSVKAAGSGRVNLVTTGKRKITQTEERTAMTTGREKCCEAAQSCCAGGSDAKEDRNSCCGAAASPAQEPCCAGQSTPAAAEEACCAQGAPAGEAAGAEAAFGEFMRLAGAPGAIDVATRQAINIALSLVTRCGPCTKMHLKKARDMGFTDEEIDAIAWQATSFGGCSVKMFYNQFKGA